MRMDLIVRCHPLDISNGMDNATICMSRYRAIPEWALSLMYGNFSHLRVLEVPDHYTAVSAFRGSTGTHSSQIIPLAHITYLRVRFLHHDHIVGG